MSASHNTSRYSLPLPENPEFYDVNDIRNLSFRAEEALISAQSRMDGLDSTDTGQNERIEQLDSSKTYIEYISYEGTGDTELCFAPFTVRPDIIWPLCKVNLSTGRISGLDDIMHPAITAGIDEPNITNDGYGLFNDDGIEYMWRSSTPAAQGNELGYKYYIAGISRVKDASVKVETEMTLVYVGPDGEKHALSGIAVSVNGKSHTADSDGVITLTGYEGQMVKLEFKAVFPVFTSLTAYHTFNADDTAIERQVFSMAEDGESKNPIIYKSTNAFASTNGGYIPPEIVDGTYICDIVPVGGGGAGGPSGWWKTSLTSTTYYCVGGGGGGGGYYPDKNDATYKGLVISSVGPVVIGEGGKGAVLASGSRDGTATSIMINSTTYSMPGGKGASRSLTERYGIGGDGGSGGGSGGSYNSNTQSKYYNASRGAANGQSAGGNGGGTGSGRIPPEVFDKNDEPILYGGGGGGGTPDVGVIIAGGAGGGNGGNRSDDADRHGKPGSYGSGGGGGGALTAPTGYVGNGGDGGAGFIAVKVYLNEDNDN